MPNEAQMLAALHLVLGGTHVTLNFDIGIELAYELLTGSNGPALSYLCLAARASGRRGEQLAVNGNRRSLVIQHRLLLSAYACLLSGQST